MKDPKRIKKCVNIMPHNYYNENILTVFAPQSKVTPEQVYWPLDVEKMKAGELKAKTPLMFATPTVYPPNPPMYLVQLALPTQCKTLISMYVLYQILLTLRKHVRRELHQRESLRVKGGLNKQKSVT